MAKKIENRIDNVKIVAILSSEQIDELDKYEFDIILSMISSLEYENKVVHISPMISELDEKNIKDACFEVMANPEKDDGSFTSLIHGKYIRFIKEKREKELVLKDAYKILYEDGYVKKEFYDDIINRENIEPTAIGNGVAIPHGTAENVCTPIVFVIRLAYPVNWGNEMVDTIFLLALNFNNIAVTKAFFSDFMKILGSEDKIGKIRKSENVVEIEKILKEQLS